MSGISLNPTSDFSLNRRRLTSILSNMEEDLELDGPGCHANCSGHGECLNGSCYCQIQYEGRECKRINFSYHVAFSSIFFLLALTSLIQLVMCIHAEYLRMKKNASIIKARLYILGLLTRSIQISTGYLTYTCAGFFDYVDYEMFRD